MLERNKKNLIVAIVAVVVVIVIGVVAGVAIKNVIDGGSGDDGEGDGAIVHLNYHPEGYSENPASSTIVAVFADEISKRLLNDSEYTYDDAISDYEAAYNNARADVKTDVAYAYARFVFNETKDADKAKDILKRIEESELNNYGAVRYYTTLSEMYKALGMEEEANHYIELREKAVPSVDLFIDGASESMEGE